jgi:hypothetical protein
MRNPVPVILAGVGLVLVAVSLFMPLAKYSDGKNSPIPFYYFNGLQTASIDTNIALDPAIPLLVLVVAATVAMASSPRWVTFGRLAAIGCGVVVIAAEASRAHTWKVNLVQIMREAGGTGADGGPDYSKALEQARISYGAGLWLLVIGVVVLAGSVMFIRVATPVPDAREIPPQGTGPTPVPRPVDADPMGIAVNDDPPSLSIYEPPKEQ